MERSAPRRETGIAVALSLANGALRGRLAAAIDATRDLHRVKRTAAIDILIIDTTTYDAGEDGLASVVLLGEPEGVLPVAVRAVLPEDAAVSTIIDAVRLVSHGLLVLPDSALDRLSWLGPEDGEDESRPPRLNGAAADHDHAAAPIVLTPREHEVLQLLAAGASNKLIARKLEISVHTAKFHVASLLRKLGASGRLEAIGIGLRGGLLMV